MGYTHYWSYLPEHDRFSECWPRMVINAKTILEHLQATGSVRVCGPSGEGGPVLTEGAIRFNGDAAAGADYESFWLDYTPPDQNDDPYLAQEYRRRGFVWGFCKTARRPYDLAVATVLLRCHLLAPDVFAIGSDGHWDRDWVPARAFYAELFGDPGRTDPFTNTTRGPRAAQHFRVDRQT